MRNFRAYGSGRWFPADEATLRSRVEQFMRQADSPAVEGQLVGATAPHAGYDYSGGIAGHTFAALARQAGQGAPVETVVVLGFSHRTAFPGVALLDADTFETPLGRSRIDRDGIDILRRECPLAFPECTVHEGEHSAENEIPFVQAATPGAAMIPALIGDHAAETRTTFAEALHTLSQTRRVVLIASTDLLHAPDFETVSQTDATTLRWMADMDAERLNRAWTPGHQVCCGISGVTVLIAYAALCGCRSGTVLAYTNSGVAFPETRGSWVVGYGSVAYAVSEEAPAGGDG